MRRYSCLPLRPWLQAAHWRLIRWAALPTRRIRLPKNCQFLRLMLRRMLAESLRRRSLGRPRRRPPRPRKMAMHLSWIFRQPPAQRSHPIWRLPNFQPRWLPNNSKPNAWRSVRRATRWNCWTRLPQKWPSGGFPWKQRHSSRDGSNAPVAISKNPPASDGPNWH